MKLYTTCKKSADHKKWLKYDYSRSLHVGKVHVFSDGSSKGSYAAVVVQPNEWVESHVSHSEPTRTRNVGAEVRGALLGLSYVPEGSKVVLVSDYPGVGAWLAGQWNIKDEEIKETITLIKNLLATKEIEIDRFYHHRGHQKDSSAFTRWNGLADALCSQLRQPAGRMSWSQVEVAGQWYPGGFVPA